MGCREKASWPAAWSPPVGVATGSPLFCPMFCRLSASTMTVPRPVTSRAKAFRVSSQLWFWMLNDVAPFVSVLVHSHSRWLTLFCHQQMSSTDPENLSHPGPTHPKWGNRQGETSPRSTRRPPHPVAPGRDGPTSRSVDRLQRSPAGHF